MHIRSIIFVAARRSTSIVAGSPSIYFGETGAHHHTRDGDVANIPRRDRRRPPTDPPPQRQERRRMAAPHPAWPAVRADRKSVV